MEAVDRRRETLVNSSCYVHVYVYVRAQTARKKDTRQTKVYLLYCILKPIYHLITIVAALNIIQHILIEGG